MSVVNRKSLGEKLDIKPATCAYCGDVERNGRCVRNCAASRAHKKDSRARVVRHG